MSMPYVVECRRQRDGHEQYIVQGCASETEALTCLATMLVDPDGWDSYGLHPVESGTWGVGVDS